MSDQTVHPPDPAPETAQAMIDALASVGAETFDVTYLDPQGKKMRFENSKLLRPGRRTQNSERRARH